MANIKIQGNASGAGTQTLQSAATTGTPTITLPDATGTLVVSGGALGTPSSVTLTNATGLPLSTGVTGNLPVSNLNSGTSASSTTFWRGDGTWATPAGSGSGTVTTVSVVSANGLAGTVANATTTPAITLSTSITGVLKGNGTAISAATAGTDYQAPITLTTTGSSGAATFVGNTLNIPQYAGGGGSPGGSTTQVQYNNAGAFAGSANMTFNGTTLTAAGLAGPFNGTVGATTPTTGVFTTATAQAAATQDSVILQGRAGGTSSYGVTLTPTTLTASRTLTLPDATGALLISGGALGTPSSGTVTNLTGTASININGTVGATTASTGAFTTLSASSTVSGTGFSTYLASPPAIGGTAAAAGTFTTGTFNTSTVHKGATSGTVTIAAPAVAGTQSYTLPTAVPAANGYALTSTTSGTMSWSAFIPGAAGSTTQVQYNNAGSLAGISGFTSDGTRVTASTTIGVGGATPSTSGSGITFPATASASSNANTLDDYEEGTWTPTLGGTATYNNQTGTYTKVGRLVTVTFNLYISVLGTGSATTVDGLPFAATGGLYMTGSPYWDSLASSRTSVGILCTGSTSFYFFGPATAGTSAANVISVFGNGAIMRGSFSYFES
jgi:hypothetical protein